MINVTLKNGDVIETSKYDYDFYTAKIIVNNEFISKKDISKIEKQIKDLTSEEIYKWAENKYGEPFVEVVIRRYYIDVRLYYSETDKFDTIEYKYEDYIDITSIVKGE